MSSRRTCARKSGASTRSDEAAAGELVERIAGEREAARSAMLVELSSNRYFDLLGVLDNITATLSVVSGGPSLETIAGREFAKLRKTILRAGSTPSDEQLHRVRIRGKRARYAAELAEPLVGKRGEAVRARGEALPGRGWRAPGRGRGRGADPHPRRTTGRHGSRSLPGASSSARARGAQRPGPPADGLGEARETRPASLGLKRAVRAAGGVVWRRDPEGRLEVLLVHRPEVRRLDAPEGQEDATGEVDLRPVRSAR